MVWYDIFTPLYSHHGVRISYDIFTPGWKYRYDIFTPPLQYFHPPSQSRQYMTDISFIIAGVLSHPMSSSVGVNNAKMYPTQCLFPLEWLYYATIYPPPLSNSMGVIISCHDIHTHSLVPWEWSYHATIYPLPLSNSMGVIISCHDIHPHSLVPWEWSYHATIYPLPLSNSMGVIISCHNISTPTL